MTREPSMDEAARLLGGELEVGGRTLADIDTVDAWLAYLRFGRRLFNVPNTPDADGLLFQYGTYSFDDPPAFTLDLIRQFEIADDRGEHHHYIQLHCELRYGLAPGLQALGSFNSWFFHDAGDDLDEWAQRLSERAAWTTIRRFKPAQLRVYEERL
ncbi:hypothetical protein [Streptomyces sp. NPDC057838]|uniref:hypothetical protein n=2 Tax=Streptomyces TaxID=1883 RepID=UPI0036914FC8